MGPNGSGKTTLMMAIIGYPEYEITEGQILDYVVVNAPQRSQEIDDLAKAFHMDPFLERDINADLSGGEIKRSELFQLLVTHPRFAMMDEPDSGVDLEALSLVGNMVNALLSEEPARPAKRKAGLIITHTGQILDYIQTDKGDQSGDFI